MTLAPWAVAVIAMAACSGRPTSSAAGSRPLAPVDRASPDAESSIAASPPAVDSDGTASAVRPATFVAAPPAAPAVGSAAAASTAPALAAATGSAAASPASGSAATTAASITVKATLGDVGLESGSLDRTADPCVDFYQFACGGWIQNNPVPPDRARWNRGAEVDARNKLAIKAVLDDAAKGIIRDPAARKLGDFYGSCMDEPGIDRAGLGALQPVLARTLAVKDAASWFAALVELHKLGIPVVWRNDVEADLKASTTNAIYLDAAGLGLPDRDYYVKPEHKDKLERYEQHVGKMLGLLAQRGVRPAPPDGSAAAVVAIETEIARLTRTAIERRDLPAAYNPTDAKALARQVRSVDWPRYFQAVGEAGPGGGRPASPARKVIVGTPALFAALDKLRARFKPAQWASYFTYHLLSSLAIALPRAFDDEALELAKLLTGVEQQRERSRRCIDLTGDMLGELLGQHYVARYFPGSARQLATLVVDAIARAMADEIAGLDWMAGETRQAALAKLARTVRMIGYPDRWKTYDFDVKRDDFAGNVLRALTFAIRRDLGKAGQPVDRGEWHMNAYQVDAYYNASTNTTVLPAGILQPPFFGLDRTVAVNLGGIAMVIGHELTHGFDDQGAQLDADGNLRNWWQKADQARFVDSGKCVAGEYSGFEALPGKFVQGELTLGENIADLGGVKIAFKAYRALRKDTAKVYIADGFSEDQQFFLAVGQAWCARERPADTELRLTVDPHSPPKFRVYGALRNLTEFADAFHCVAGTPMRPARTCNVW